MATISLKRIKVSLYSIRWKILIAYLLIITVAFSMVAVTLLQLVGDYMFNQRIREDQRIAESLSDQMSEAFFLLDSESMYALSQSASLDGSTRVLVLDRYGVVQTDAFSLLNGRRFETAEISEVLTGADSAYGFYEADLTGTFATHASIPTFGYMEATTGLYAVAIRAGEETVGALVYISQTNDIYESLNTIRTRVLVWLMVVAAIVMVLCMFVVRTITRPVGELSEGIVRMGRGDLSSRVAVRGKNEFSQLATAFNSMSEKLERLDKTRSQFVSNASHELKTPLSTMKILLETLLYQEPFDPGMTKEFLTDINNEIDRLNRIVSDLLTLVNMDSDGIRLNTAEIRLRDVVSEQVKRLSPLARERGIELECNIRDAGEMLGDVLKLSQVVYNVIDNAIKYTPRGGEVHVDLSRSQKKLIVRISDTGIGIPQEHLEHIFDRFYRVDKARSRETGGTGLGLSIVKQMVVLHGGNITAQSAENVGTTFTIELPALAK